MRLMWPVLFLLALTMHAPAQEEGGEKPPADPEGGAEAGAEEEQPAAQTAWKLPDRDHRKMEGFLADYLHPGKKSRQDIYQKFLSFVEKSIDGHSPLEDVAGIFAILNHQREYDQRIGRKGRIVEVDVKPEVHGFPGGIGTVKYHLYLPKSYNPRQGLAPLIFCLPDNREWPDGSLYIEKHCLKENANVAEDFVIVVPRPQAKGQSWAEPKSYARAMIALRHVCGTFDAEKKTAGPAIDMCRVFVGGEEDAAVVAARFAEMFAGAVLLQCRGETEGGPNLRKIGGISGLPAYCIYDPTVAEQQQFAEKIKAANGVSMLVPKDENDPAKLAAWLTGLPACSQPQRIEYTVHDPSFQRHYWINVLEYDAAFDPAPWFEAEVDRGQNTVRIEVNGITRFELFLNDALVDLSAELRVVVVSGETEYEFFKDTPKRDLGVMLEELIASNHPWRIYPVRFVVDLPTLREKRAREEAAKAAAAKGAGSAKVKPGD